MILRSAQIRDYKSITNSGEVRIEEDVTCLVGKNESGKTAFLESLYRLNPVPTGHPDTFVPLRDFPRPRYTDDGKAVEGVHPIAAMFELEPSDAEAVAAAVGEGVLLSTTIEVSRSYGNVLYWDFEADEEAAVRHLVDLHGAKASLAQGCSTVEQLARKLDTQAESGGVTPPPALHEAARSLDVNESIIEALETRLPRFFYFDEYSELPGRVSITLLQHTPEEDLSAEERTALSLLRLAGVEGAEFTEDQYEARRASLEAASSTITREVFEYWSQNKNLRVTFDADFKGSEDTPPEQLPLLEIRIENLRYWVSLNFAERSAGFQWFFSFLAAFSEFRTAEEPVILLLDEPALGLHATAQRDLLRYIDERLARSRQVVYTTHSPFLVDPTKLHRARTVEDRDDEGTKVGEEVLGTSQETLFPLQAALGYEIAQSLFVAPDNIVVEGPADYLYLTIMNDHLRSNGREELDPRWVVVPVGGADKIPTFIALLGAHLNVAVVLDGAAGGSQKVNTMIKKGVINSKAVLPLASITGGKEADIEDMFDESWYLALARASGAASVTKAQLGKGHRIVRRMEAAVGKFDHYQPAAHLLREQQRFLPRLKDDTLDRFEELFKRANALLS